MLLDKNFVCWSHILGPVLPKLFRYYLLAILNSFPIFILHRFYWNICYAIQHSFNSDQLGEQYLLNILSNLLETISNWRIKKITQEINYIRKNVLENIEIFTNYSACILWTYHSPLPYPCKLSISPEHIYQNNAYLVFDLVHICTDNVDARGFIFKIQ